MPASRRILKRAAVRLSTAGGTWRVKLRYARMRRVIALLFLGLAASVSPANADWPEYQLSPAHNAILPGDQKIHWIIDIGEKDNGGLAVDHDMIFLDDFSGKVMAFDAKTGNPAWSTDVGTIAMSTPIVADGLVIVGTGRNGRLYPSGSDYTWGRSGGDDVIALDGKTGAIIWKFHTVGENMPSPAYVHGRIVFANGDQHAYGLDARTGRLLWKIALNGIANMASATIVGEDVLLSSCSVQPYECETILVNSNDGHLVWKSPFGGADCSPNVGEGTVFVSQTSDETRVFTYGGVAIVSALSLRNGKLLWQYRSPVGPYTAVGSSERTISGTYWRGTYYQALPLTDGLTAFDATSGHINWTFQSIAPIKQSPIIVNGRLYIGDTGGMFYTIDALTGQLIHGAPFNQPFSPSPPVAYGGTILVTGGHYLYAFPVMNGEY